MKNLSYTTSASIATITWDLPGRSMNVLTEDSLREFAECVERACADSEVKGILITSAKPAFIAGADLTMLGGASQRAAGGDPADRAKAMFEANLSFNMLLRKLETCGKPVAAAINGTALGGGFEICLASHYRVVGDDPKIQLGLPESKVGVMPGGGGTQRLPRLIGAMQALPLLLQGKTLSPQAALGQGLVHKVVPKDQVVAEAQRWLVEEGKSKTKQPWDESGYKIPGGGPYTPQGLPVFMMGSAMLRKESYGNYPAQKAIMQAVYEGLQVPIEAGLRIESRLFTSLLLHPTARNMIRSLFLSMQELEKGARRPAGEPTTEVKKLGVLGAGMMGAGIAYVSAGVRIEVVLLDTELANAERGKQHAAELMDQRILKGRATTKERQELLDRIHPTVDFSDLAGCDLVIEAVFEDRKIKADVTKKAEAVLGPDAIFGSNTSTLPITGLAEASVRPESFLGIHFFSPVERMQLVELIVGKKTAPRAIATALDYVKKIRKTPIVVNDSRGFYTSRCFGTYVGEGILMLAEGIAPALIENAGRATGMPRAPLEMNDDVALDLGYKVRQQTKKDLGAAYVETPADRIVEKMVVGLQRYGRKNRKGFYEYPEGGKKRLWPGLGELVREITGKEPVDEPPVEELKQRLLYIQALEAARCFEEKVVTDVRDADVGAILGWGFAPWSGGPLSLIDTVGARRFVAECEELARRHGKRFEPNSLLREMAEKGETFYRRFAPQREQAA
jgi:3-hydroxyacyl-CoA dehydrogenase / enoyl-CoA hydratase / 3-hydroxybutyryl-CoA epimerase